MEKNKLKKEILAIWIIVLIGFGNLILIIGVHLLDGWFDSKPDYQRGFEFFGINILGNVVIDSLYILIFILQIILMYFMLENRIKKIIIDNYEKKL